MTEEPWNKHTPGDPMPCKCGDSVVEVRLRNGYRCIINSANQWKWGKLWLAPDAEITDWRFVERKGEDVITRPCDVLTPAEPQLLALLTVATLGEAYEIRQAARRANIEVPG